MSFALERHRNRWSRLLWQFIAPIALALTCSAVAHAQWQGPPERPGLAAGADQNDWSAYYDKGVELLRGDPAGSGSRVLLGLAHRASARRTALRALGRIPQPRPATLSRLSRRRQENAGRSRRARRGFAPPSRDDPQSVPPPRPRDRTLRSARRQLGLRRFQPRSPRVRPTQLPSAAALPTRAIKSDPKGYLWQRLMLAQAFVAMANYDSAFAEVQTIRTALDRRDAKKLVVVYDSREFLDYALALLESARGNAAAARGDPRPRAPRKPRLLRRAPQHARR